MIALLLMLQTMSTVVSDGSTTGMARAVSVEHGDVALMEEPPCGTPEAAKATSCTKWQIFHPAMMQMPDGYVGRMDQLSEMKVPLGAGRTVAAHGAQYLNIGGGRALLMSSGRCSFSTEWHGRYYADQDFDLGAGVGAPRKGAKPCS